MSIDVTFLGSADAFNARGQCHACHLVRTPTAKALLDCGPTSLMALKRNGLSANDIDCVFLSHLHGDHFAGVPFLLLANIYDTPRERPFTVVGPPGTRARIDELYRILYSEISQRPLPYRFECIETSGGETIEINDFSVRGFRVPHQEKEVSLGLKVTNSGKTILYSGDTGWTEDLVEESSDTDLFICECCYFETRVDFHLDYPRIAENRARFGCKNLVLTHLGSEVAQRLDEIDCTVSTDGMNVQL